MCRNQSRNLACEIECLSKREISWKKLLSLSNTYWLPQLLPAYTNSSECRLPSRKTTFRVSSALDALTNCMLWRSKPPARPAVSISRNQPGRRKLCHQIRIHCYLLASDLYRRPLTILNPFFAAYLFNQELMSSDHPNPEYYSSPQPLADQRLTRASLGEFGL